jgi:hypothetical protein
LWYNYVKGINKNMRNKKTFKYALILGVIAPIFVFSLAFAQFERPTMSAEQQRARSAESMSKPDREGEGSENREIKDGAARRKMLAAGIAKMMENQVNRAERALTRLDQIMGRIQSRYDKLADMEDVDLSKVDPLITKAKQQKIEVAAAITKAKADWEAFKTASEVEGGDPRPAGKAFMVSIRDLNKKLIAFHKTLHDVVQAMKNAEETNN